MSNKTARQAGQQRNVQRVVAPETKTESARQNGTPLAPS
jgi:hypothetical protein